MIDENKKPSRSEVKKAIARLKETIAGNKEVLKALMWMKLKDSFADELRIVIDEQENLLKWVKNLLKGDLKNE